MKKTAVVAAPVTGVQILHDIDAAVGKMGKISGKGTNHVARAMRSIVDDDVELRGVAENLRLCRGVAGIADYDRYARVDETERRTFRIDVHPDNGFCANEVFRPGVERASVLD